MRAVTIALSLALAFATSCASTSRSCANCEKAQSVVVSVQKLHPNCTRLSIHCPMGSGMAACASTDAARIGKASDPEDARAVQTAQVIVMDENGAFDVTVPINQKEGKPTAACGVTLKGAGMGREQAVAEATAIATAVEAGLGGCCDCCCTK